MNRTMYERQQARQRREKRHKIEAFGTLAFFIFCVLVAIFACGGMAEGAAYVPYDEPEYVQVTEKPKMDPVYAQHMAYLKDLEENGPEVPRWDWSDTPVLDANDDNFEMLVECAFAEAGNQSEYGIRLVVDVIGNRAGWEMSHVDDVITAKNQFSSYPNGMAKWRNSITEEFIQIVADEWTKETKACGNLNLWYFRTKHYSPHGKSWKPVGDHFFSTKE